MIGWHGHDSASCYNPLFEEGYPGACLLKSRGLNIGEVDNQAGKAIL
jgi:hypothetical protein